MPNDHRSLKWLIWLGLAAVLPFAFLLRERPSAPIPAVDLRGIEPGAAASISNCVAQVKQNKKSGTAWGNLGALLWTYSMPRQASECLQRAESLEPNNPRWPYFQYFILAGPEPAEALQKLRRTVELCGNEPEQPRLRLATSLLENGDWAAARQQVQQLIAAKPDFAPAHLLQAQAAQAAGDFDAASWRALSERCLDDPRTRRAARVLLIPIYQRQGDTNAADRLGREAAKMPPDEPVADPLVAEIELLRNDPARLTEQLHPLLAAGRLGQAEPLVAQLTNQHSRFAESWLLAGRFHMLKGNVAEAENAFATHLALAPDSSQGYFQLGLLQLNRRQFPAAVSTFAKAVELKPDFGPAYYNRGLALASSGQLVPALEMFAQAARFNPERIDSYLMAAEVSLRLGQKTAAAAWLEKAKLLNPAHPAIGQFQGRLKIQD